MSKLGNNPFIQSMRLRNFLSFGNSTDEIEIKSLNVFIGPNASGKSNLIEAFSILNAAPTDLMKPISPGGGISEWLWKGVKGCPIAEIDITVRNPKWPTPLRHRISFTMSGQSFELIDEVIENKNREREELDDVRFFYRYRRGKPVLSVKSKSKNDDKHLQRNLSREELEPNQSVLSQRKDPDQYPEITYLGDHYKRIKLYQEWDLGRDTPP